MNFVPIHRAVHFSQRVRAPHFMSGWSGRVEERFSRKFGRKSIGWFIY